MKARTQLGALACIIGLLQTAHASPLREGQYTGTLWCGPRLTDATYGAWTDQINVRVTSSGIYWRRESPSLLEEGEARPLTDGFEFAAEGQFRAQSNASDRWIIVGRFDGTANTLRGAAKLLNRETKQTTRNCTLGASWASPLISASDWDAGRNPPLPTAEMTFFGYQMDGPSPTWRGPSDSGRVLAGTRFWEDKFRMSENKTPKWLVGPMDVTLQTTGDGRIREATFSLNTFENNNDMISPAVRTKKMTALVALLIEKFGVPPDSRIAAPWTLIVPWDHRTRLPTEVATWTRPWGTARLFSCEYNGYREECAFDAFAPSLHVETKTRINARSANRIQEQGDKTRTDASRVKL